MRTKAELQKRLREAAQARKQLLDEEATATKEQQVQSQQELALEIANLSGVIGVLEWVLQTNVGVEYDVEAADTH